MLYFLSTENFYLIKDELETKKNCIDTPHEQPHSTNPPAHTSKEKPKIQSFHYTYKTFFLTKKTIKKTNTN